MFALKKPCSSCPFRKEGGVRLTVERANEVAGYFLDGRGATFPCHASVHDDDDDVIEQDVDASNKGDDGAKDRMGERWVDSNWQMCAGGMIFAHKLGQMSTMMQLGVNLRLMKLDELQDGDQVFDSRQEMLDANRRFGEGERR